MEAHLSQEEAARLIGINKTQFSKIERGINMPGPQVLWSIAAIFKCNVGELYIVTGTPEKNSESHE